jgi:hypothetical protein
LDENYKLKIGYLAMEEGLSVYTIFLVLVLYLYFDEEDHYSNKEPLKLDLSTSSTPCCVLIYIVSSSWCKGVL